MILVSVVIPTKNRPVAVADAVQSVFEGSYQHFEILVVDQSDDNSTFEALSKFTVDHRFHYRTNRRPGYGAASSRNIGIALSAGDVIAIIDDDVVVRQDWMARIVAEFEADQELGFITGKLTAPEYDRNAGFTPEFTPYKGLNKWRLPLVVAGANLSMRRSMFEKTGGYDEFCGPGSRIGASDDGDLTLRVVHHRIKWKGCPDIEVIHKHGFRPKVAGDALVRRYQVGNGGIYGRAMRRGQIAQGLWFLVRETREATRAGLRGLLGKRPTGFDMTKAKLSGFWRGFRLPPRDGFVTGGDLWQMRQDILMRDRLARENMVTTR
jgi:glycosyltransferase involved in cell wall biosynthesis